MSDADTDLDLDLDDTDLDGSPDGDGEDADASGAPPSDNPADRDGNESKRISDLTSKWQKAEARAKKAEAALKTKETPADKDGEQIPEAIRRWMDAAKGAARDRYFNADKRFAEYGLELALIDGEEPDEMQASAKRLSALIDAVEQKARERVLEEHGLSAESVGSAPATKVDFGSMSDEEFMKFLNKRDGR